MYEFSARSPPVFNLIAFKGYALLVSSQADDVSPMLRGTDSEYVDRFTDGEIMVIIGKM